MSAPFDLSRRTLTVATGQALVKLPQIVVTVVLVRLTTEAEWNTLSFALTVYLVGVGLGGLNIQQGVYFFYTRLDRTRRRGFMVQTTALLGACAALAATVVIATTWWLPDDALGVGPLLPWIALVVLLEVPTSAAAQLLLSAERPTLSAVFTGGMAVVQAVVLIVPLALGEELATVLHGLVGYGALRLLLYVVIVLWITPGGRAWLDRRQLREQLVYTAPLALSMATSIINRSLDKWLVAGFAPADFGVYYLAAQEVPLVTVLPYAMGAVVATRYVWAFKQRRPELALAYWRAAVSRTALMVVPATVGVILCAPELIPLLFTSENAAAVLPFQIYSVILLHRVAEYGVVLRAAGDTRSLWFASLTLLGANVAFSVPLVYGLGMLGAALGTLLANVVAWIYVLTRIARITGVGLGRVFPWRSYTSLLLTSVACGVLARVIAVVVTSTAPALLALEGALFFGLFAIAYRALGLSRRLPAVPADDPAFVRNIS